MLYVASKLIGFLLQPSTALCLLALFALWRAYRMRRQGGGLRLLTSTFVAIGIAGFSPLATWLILPLEQRFPAAFVPEVGHGYAGIIVLGGAEDGRISAARGQLHLNEAAERITEAAKLARRLPGARLVFTGGAALLLVDDVSGAGPVAAFWRAMGIEASRITVESQSRNTYENARLTHAIVNPGVGDRWLLVTSAAHMPRAIGVFRAAGFVVTAYPVDYRTRGPAGAFEPFGSVPAGLKRLDEATREWIGLLAYRLLGRTNHVFPAP